MLSFCELLPIMGSSVTAPLFLTTGHRYLAQAGHQNTDCHSGVGGPKVKEQSGMYY